MPSTLLPFTQPSTQQFPCFFEPDFLTGDELNLSELGKCIYIKMLYLYI